MEINRSNRTFRCTRLAARARAALVAPHALAMGCSSRMLDAVREEWETQQRARAGGAAASPACQQGWRLRPTVIAYGVPALGASKIAVGVWRIRFASRAAHPSELQHASSSALVCSSLLAGSIRSLGVAHDRHGVEHRPHADEECAIMLFEPAATRNTGNVVNERTVTEAERI
jgi:hypothetical protein